MKKFGYCYLDQGDSCDGYPRLSPKMYDNEQEAIDEMMKDVTSYLDTLDIKNDGDNIELIKDNIKQVYIKYFGHIKCMWTVVETEV